MPETALSDARALLKLDSAVPRRSVVKLLRDRRNALHPDKTGGTFPTVVREREYHAVNSLLDRLKPKEETRSVAVSKEASAIVKANTEMVRSMVEEARLSRERQAQIDAKRDIEAARIQLESASGQTFHRAKFGLWGAGVLSAALVAIKEPLSAFSEYAGVYAPSLNLAFALMSVLAIVAGYLSHLAEQSEKARSRQMLTGRGIRALLAVMNEDHTLYMENVRLEDFTSAVATYIRTADAAAAEEAAKAIVAQLLQQGLITASDQKSVSPTYLTTDELRDEGFQGRGDLEMMKAYRSNPLLKIVAILRT